MRELTEEEKAEADTKKAPAKGAKPIELTPEEQEKLAEEKKRKEEERERILEEWQEYSEEKKFFTFYEDP